MNTTKLVLVVLSVVTTAAFAAETRIKFQSAFASGDTFVSANKGRNISGNEYHGMGFKKSASNAITIGAMRVTSARPAELGSVATANSASDADKRAVSTITQGNWGGIAPVLGTTSCYYSTCEMNVGWDIGNMTMGSGDETRGLYCISSSSAPCTPTSSYDYYGAFPSTTDGNMICAKAVEFYHNYYDGTWSMAADPTVICKICSC